MTIRRVRIEPDPYLETRDQRRSLPRDEPLLSQSHGHVIIEGDAETMRGRCGMCGEVDLALQKTRANVPIFVCRNLVQDKRRGQKSRNKAHRQVRVRDELRLAGKVGYPGACTCRYHQADPECPFDPRLTADPAASKHPGWHDEERV